MGFHNPLGDRQAEARSLTTIGLLVLPSYELFEHMWKHSWRNAWPVVGYGQSQAESELATASISIRVSGWRMRDGIADDVVQRLFDKCRVRANQRETFRNPRCEVLDRSMSLRTTDNASDNVAQINPVQSKFQRSGINPGDCEEIAHHVIEALRLILDLFEKIATCIGPQLVTVFDEAGGCPEN